MFYATAINSEFKMYQTGYRSTSNHGTTVNAQEQVNRTNVRIIQQNYITNERKLHIHQTHVGYSLKVPKSTV